MLRRVDLPVHFLEGLLRELVACPQCLVDILWVPSLFLHELGLDLRGALVLEHRLHEEQVRAIEGQGLVEHGSLFVPPLGRRSLPVRALILTDSLLDRSCVLYQVVLFQALRQAGLVEHDVAGFVEAELRAQDSGGTCRLWHARPLHAWWRKLLVRKESSLHVLVLVLGQILLLLLLLLRCLRLHKHQVTQQVIHRGIWLHRGRGSLGNRHACCAATSMSTVSSVNADGSDTACSAMWGVQRL
mmetsp:Transcript_49143/g.126742  ORF Transcript_49143/g.126742 Transcript_49143/m.126742 type:complete len:243 (-) Transcript_49143:2149-2877(-)